MWSKSIDTNYTNELSSAINSEDLEQTEPPVASSVNSEFESNIDEKVSENNGLENFELSDDDTPELFNSDTNEELSTSPEEIKSEELNSNNLDSGILNETSNTLNGETLNKAEASEVDNESADFESKTEKQETENNGLENFELSDDDTPELFNSDTNEEVLTTSDEVNSPDEEDLEIPAFLRRQKN